MRIRVVSLNIAHGRGMAKHQALISRRTVQRNLGRIADYLDRTEADVVCLQEADLESSWSGRIDHLNYLADRTSGLRHIAFGPNVRVQRGRLGLHYGNAVLSRFPVSDFFVTPFPLRVTGKKGFLTASLDTPFGRVDVASLHLDFVRAKTRREQLDIVVQSLSGEHPRPLIVAGDFNACRFKEGDLFDRLSALGLEAGVIDRRAHATFPSPKPRRSIDHIWVTAPLSFVGYEVSDVMLSDHRPVVAELQWEGDAP